MSRNEQELKGVTLLGNQNTQYNYDYTPEVLEVFENKHPENEYLVTLDCPEFTSLCPKTGQPDFGHIIINYIQQEPEALPLQLPQPRRFPRGLRQYHHERLGQADGSQISGGHRIVQPSWRHLHQTLRQLRRRRTSRHGETPPSLSLRAKRGNLDRKLLLWIASFLAMTQSDNWTTE